MEEDIEKLAQEIDRKCKEVVSRYRFHCQVLPEDTCKSALVLANEKANSGGMSVFYEERLGQDWFWFGNKYLLGGKKRYVISHPYPDLDCESDCKSLLKRDLLPKMLAGTILSLLDSWYETFSGKANEILNLPENQAVSEMSTRMNEQRIEFLKSLEDKENENKKLRGSVADLVREIRDLRAMLKDSKERIGLLERIIRDSVRALEKTRGIFKSNTLKVIRVHLATVLPENANRLPGIEPSEPWPQDYGSSRAGCHGETGGGGERSIT